MQVRRDRVLAWTMPIVLVLVAVTQITLAHTNDLTPWKGGGFGMFASVDLLSYRPVQGAFETDDGPVWIDVHDFRSASDGARKAYENARGMPDERRMGHLIELIRQAEWVVTDGVAEFGSWLDDPDSGPVVRDGTADEPDLHVTSGYLEIWRTTYERGSQFVEPEYIGRFDFGVAGR